jgi:NTP pyrophosphatase (non-canonical NTP hydrolase)
MNFSEYQDFARTTAVYPNIGNNLWYPTLGLCGEAGEISEKVKKLYRDKDGVIDGQFIVDLTKELGDQLWYIAALASEININLETIAEINVQKLSDRKTRGQLHGSGDNR